MEVRQGFIRSKAPDDSWSEAVTVAFDPDRVGLDRLVEVHLATHSATANHVLRSRYRSAVYGADDEAILEADAAIARWAERHGVLPVTRALALTDFRPSPERIASSCWTRAVSPKKARMRRCSRSRACMPSFGSDRPPNGPARMRAAQTGPRTLDKISARAIVGARGGGSVCPSSD